MARQYVVQDIRGHLAGLESAAVSVTLEISVDIPDGVSEQVPRMVMENCRVLKFESFGFEVEQRAWRLL